MPTSCNSTSIVSRTREQQIRAASDERIARAQLNQLMGEPLGEVFVLDRSAAAAAIDATDLASLEAEAIENRPDVKLAALQEQLAGASRDGGARRIPAAGGGAGRLGIQRRRLERTAPRAGSSGPSRASTCSMDSRTRRGSPKRASRRRDAPWNARKAETAARLDVHIAVARLDAARASEAVGRAAGEQARESRRIIRDRYEAGLDRRGVAAARRPRRWCRPRRSRRGAGGGAHRNRGARTGAGKAMTDMTDEKTFTASRAASPWSLGVGACRPVRAARKTTPADAAGADSASRSRPWP